MNIPHLSAPVIGLVGGGSGGHATPLRSLHALLAPRHPDWRWLWLGESGGIDERLAREAGIDFLPVRSGKLRRYLSVRTFTDPWKNVLGFFDARRILRESGVGLLFSKGGYVSLPVALAARSLGIPVFLHESDTRAWLANRLVGRLASRVFLGFPEAAEEFPKAPTETVGQILSPIYLDAAKKRSDDERSHEGRPRLLVTCGSQWSQRMFKALLRRPELFERYETTVLTGTLNESFVPKFEAVGHGTRAFPFLTPAEQSRWYAWADVAITRGSATTLAELALFGIRCLIVPLPETGGNHQEKNGRHYEGFGHVMISDRDFLDPKTDFAGALDRLRERPETSSDATVAHERIEAAIEKVFKAASDGL